MSLSAAAIELAVGARLVEPSDSALRAVDHVGVGAWRVTSGVGWTVVGVVVGVWAPGVGVTLSDGLGVKVSDGVGAAVDDRGVDETVVVLGDGGAGLVRPGAGVVGAGLLTPEVRGEEMVAATAGRTSR